MKPIVSTGLPGMDEFWTLQPGGLTVVTGIPNHGKSGVVQQIAVDVARSDGWRWAVFSPEHSPQRHVIRLIEKFSGKPFSKQWISETDVHCAIDWLHEYFALIRPEEDRPTIDFILERARWAAIRMGINGLIIDPWNQVESARPSNMTETEYIGDCLRKVRRFGESHGVCTIVVAHPTKLRRKDDGEFDPPSLYDIAGSANWANMVDAGVVVHRNNATQTTEIFIRKIREQPDMGSIGSITLRFNEEKRRYESPPPPSWAA